MKRHVFLVLFVFAFGLWVAAQTTPAADLIILNARIWTVDSSQPEAQAVAILGDRSVGVGSSQQVEVWRGPHTRVFDAGGRRLLPGFNDSHVHFADGGAQLDNVELNDATSPREFARRIRERAAKTAKGEWLLGGDWDETKWSPAELPMKGLIDPATPETPVAVNRYDGHMILANSVALELAGITAKTPDPAGGVIVRDRQGNPTGALKDAAMDLMVKAVPAPSHDQRRHAIERARTCRLSGRDQRAEHESRLCRHRDLFGAARRRQTPHAHLCCAIDHTGGRPGEDRRPAGVWRPVSAHRCREGICGWLTRIGNSVLLRTFLGPDGQSRLALRRDAAHVADAGSHDAGRRRRSADLHSRHRSRRNFGDPRHLRGNRKSAWQP